MQCKNIKLALNGGGIPTFQWFFMERRKPFHKCIQIIFKKYKNINVTEYIRFYFIFSNKINVHPRNCVQTYEMSEILLNTICCIWNISEISNFKLMWRCFFFEFFQVFSAHQLCFKWNEKPFSLTQNNGVFLKINFWLIPFHQVFERIVLFV